jgi:hypothetical protein
MSSLFFPFSPAWCFPVSPVPGSSVRRFVLHFEGAAPCGFVAWVRACPAVEVERVFPSSAWRSFGAGVAVRLVVRDLAIADAIRKSAAKGGGGSLHPGNKMLS